jgi:hypothetical protein
MTLRAPQDAGHARGVHGPGAAEGEEREALDVQAPLDGVDARGRGHALVGQLVDAPGRLDEVEAEGAGHALGDRPRGRVAVEPHLPAQGEVGVQVAEDEVRVGHGGLGAPAAVGDGAGARAGALGADAQPAEGVDARERAAARADLDHLDHGHLDREPAALLELVAAIDLELRADQGLAVDDEADLGRGPAHVEGEEVSVAEESPVVRGGERAGRRARLDEPHRVARPGVRLAEAAVRLHDVEPAVDPEAAEPVPQAPEVAGGEALDVDVRQRGGGALELADLRYELARQRDGDVGQRLPQEGADASLGGGVRVGVEQADRHGLDPRRAELRRQPAHLRGVDGPAHGAVRQDALVELEAQVPGGRGAGPAAWRGRTCRSGARARSRWRPGSPAW